MLILFVVGAGVPLRTKVGGQEEAEDKLQAVQPLRSCCAQPTWTQLNRSSTNQHVDPFFFFKKKKERVSSTGFKLKLYVVLHISDTTCI